MTTPATIALSLIVPVRNEAKNIVPLVREITDRVDVSHEILIVYDNEADDTLLRREELRAFGDHVMFIRNRHGLGVINALKTGFDAADSELMAPIMADMSDTPETLNAMYQKIIAGYDLVVGSRYAPGGRKIGGPRVKYYLSFLANNLLYRLSSIPTHDMTNAFVMYRRNVLDEIEIRASGGFEVTMELIAKAWILGYRVTEVPTINRERHAGESKFQLLRWIGKYMYWFGYIVMYSAARNLNRHYQRDG